MPASANHPLGRTAGGGLGWWPGVRFWISSHTKIRPSRVFSEILRFVLAPLISPIDLERLELPPVGLTSLKTWYLLGTVATVGFLGYGLKAFGPLVSPDVFLSMSICAVEVVDFS